MDIVTLLNLGAQGTALGVALGVLVIGCVCELVFWRTNLWPRISGAVMPAALTAGFAAGYAVAYENGFPRGTEDRPWYLDVSWKMVVAGVMFGGGMLAASHLVGGLLESLLDYLARLQGGLRWSGGPSRGMQRVARVVPWVSEVALVVLMIVGVVLMMVRGPWMAMGEQFAAWESWGKYALLLAGMLGVYLLSAAALRMEPRLWLPAVLVMWIALSAAGVTVMFVSDQKVGRLVVMGAVLAGLVGVCGIWPRMRRIAIGGVPFLAVLFAVLMMTVGFYNWESTSPLVGTAFTLLVCAPLGLAVLWLHLLRPKKLRLWGMVAVGLALVLAGSGVVVGFINAPPPETVEFPSQ